MATVDVNGTLIDFPDNLSPDQLQSAVAQAAWQISGKPQEKSLMSKASDLLSLPEKKSREGLNMIAEAVSPKKEVTGNLPRDIAMNLPRIAAETMADTAPSFISKGAILTGGALKGAKLLSPIVKGAGSLVAKGSEALSGLEHKTPGILTEAANSTKILFGKGKQIAKPFYEAAKKPLQQNQTIFAGIVKPAKVYEKAVDYISKGGKLEPIEAFQARKAADKMIRSGKYVNDELIPFRETMDKIAKTNRLIKAGDIRHASGVKSEAARNFLPQNKTGGSSTFKTMVGATLKGIGSLGVMSPIVQTSVATGAGLAARAASPLVNNAAKAGPVLAALAKTITEDKAREYLRKAKNNPDKARQMAKADGYSLE